MIKIEKKTILSVTTATANYASPNHALAHDTLRLYLRIENETVDLS